MNKYSGKNDIFEGDIPYIGNNMCGGLRARKNR